MFFSKPISNNSKQGSEATKLTVFGIALYFQRETRESLREKHGAMAGNGIRLFY